GSERARRRRRAARRGGAARTPRGSEQPDRAGRRGARQVRCAFSAHVEVDDDLAGVAADVADLDLLAEMPGDLVEQRQRVVIVHEAHRLARVQRGQGPEDRGVPEALGDAARVEAMDVLTEDVEGVVVHGAAPEDVSVGKGRKNKMTIEYMFICVNLPASTPQQRPARGARVPARTVRPAPGLGRPAPYRAAPA